MDKKRFQHNMLFTQTSCFFMLINFYFLQKKVLCRLTCQTGVIPLINLFFSSSNFIIEDHSNLTGFFFKCNHAYLQCLASIPNFLASFHFQTLDFLLEWHLYRKCYIVRSCCPEEEVGLSFLKYPRESKSIYMNLFCFCQSPTKILGNKNA